MWLVRLLPAFDADYSDGPTRGNVSTQRIRGRLAALPAGLGQAEWGWRRTAKSENRFSDNIMRKGAHP
jgi:hypothetical protein